MNRLVLCSSLAAIACGGRGGGDPDAGLGTADSGQWSAADAACPECGEPARLTYFVFDQRLDRIVRLSDDNGDGDMLDPGEVTVFFDNEHPLGVFNSQGMVALGPAELLATDNVGGENEDSNVVHLQDQNGDGDAMDEGEARLWYSGALPGGGVMSFPTALELGPTGEVYLVHNNAFDEEPDLILRLEDLNEDGDVDDPGEAVVHFDLATVDPVPQIFELEVSEAGIGYVVDVRTPVANTASVDRVASGGSSMAEIIDAAGLYTLTGESEALGIPPGPRQITWDSAREEIILSTREVFTPWPAHLVAMADRDESGAIDAPDEVRIIWDVEKADAADGSGLSDLNWIPDGSIVISDPVTNRFFRLVDLNEDGDFNDTGEMPTAHDASLHETAGLPIIEQMFTTAIWVHDG
jgi:hypothetical protein